MKKLAFLLLLTWPLYGQSGVVHNFPAVQISNGGTFTNTQMNEYAQFLLNSCSPLNEYQSIQGTSRYSTDALAGCITPLSGATVTNINAVAGYVTSTANSSGRTRANSVGLYGQCRVLINAGACWGQNTVTQDVAPPSSPLSGSYSLTGIETDINFWGTPNFMTGILVTGNWRGTFPAGSSAFGVGYGSGSTQKWPIGYNCGNQSANICLLVNPLNLGNSQPSQFITFGSTSSGGVTRKASIQEDANGNLKLFPDSTAGGYVVIANGTLVLPGLTSGKVMLGTQASYNSGGSRTISFPDATGNMLVTGNGKTALQTARTAGCTTGSSAGSTCASAVTVTWTTAYADTNYTVTCTGDGLGAGTPSAPYIVSKSAGGITFNYFAITAVVSSYAVVDCTAIHD